MAALSASSLAFPGLGQAYALIMTSEPFTIAFQTRLWCVCNPLASEIKLSEGFGPRFFLERH
jgi:hypothetical protein